AYRFDDLRDQLRNATPLRVFAIARALADGMSVDEVHSLTRIDRWFLKAIAAVVRMHGRLAKSRGKLSADVLREAKEMGFSDHTIETLTGAARGTVRERRKSMGIEREIAQIDTLAAEFPADTNYLYTTFHAARSDVVAARRKKIMVLGSGPYRIGSSVE